ncbi:MAG: MFS transporter [Clostridia bacterium]|nr:MFS transporter [Clostridia bacterium]
MDKKQMTRNKICFGLGTVGRDALYSLISMFLINHLTGVVGLSDNGLFVIGIALTILGIMDAVIDPFVGILVDNTNTKFGRYKPWIVGGMIGTAILALAMFHNIRMEEPLHIVLLIITYFLFSFAFSANDLSYWSLLPSLSKYQKGRESMGAFARICANVGMFSMVIIYNMVPDIFSFTGLEKRDIYFVFAIITVLIMCAFQLITVFGVKEDKTKYEVTKRTTLNGMWKALLQNDQLMVIAIAMALFMIGYSVTTAFGVYYFRYAFQDDSMYMVFAAVLAVAQLTALSVFPLFRKKFTRKQLYFGSMITVSVSYIIFFLSFELLPLVIIAGLGLFFAQAFIQLLMLLFLADAIEYGEWKLGKRNEAVSFAVQPFINQIGSAVSKGVVSVTLVITGLNALENSIADTTDQNLIKEIAAKATAGDVWGMKISMMIIPLILIVAGFILYSKKFKIYEEFYQQILTDLATKKPKKKKKTHKRK